LGDFSTTGDGLCSALQVLAILEIEKRKNPKATMSELGALYNSIPQKLNNIKYEGKDPLEVKEVNDFIKQITDEMGQSGRILIRKSGTEPLIRVMVEHEDEKKLEEIMEKISNKIKSFV
jgi:phosphoglucosamine mutase